MVTEEQIKKLPFSAQAIIRELQGEIKKFEKFVKDVKEVIGFGYETMRDMIKDLEYYIKELEK